MKLALFALFLSPLISVGAEFENYKINIDWNDARTLEDNVVQTCDDTHYPAVEITVPGKTRKDFYIDMDVEITTGTLSPGCTVKRKVNANSVTYTIDAESSCTIRVYQLNAPPRTKNKTAVYDISDAC